MIPGAEPPLTLEDRARVLVRELDVLRDHECSEGLRRAVALRHLRLALRGRGEREEDITESKEILKGA